MTDYEIPEGARCSLCNSPIHSAQHDDMFGTTLYTCKQGHRNGRGDLLVPLKPGRVMYSEEPAPTLPANKALGYEPIGITTDEIQEAAKRGCLEALKEVEKRIKDKQPVWLREIPGRWFEE